MAEKTPIKEQIKALTENIEEGIQNLFQSGDLEKYQAYKKPQLTCTFTESSNCGFIYSKETACHKKDDSMLAFSRRIR